MNHELNEKGDAGVADAGNKKRLREFYRSRRPEYYSDSEIRYEVPLTRELFDLQLERLSTNKKQSEFENFIVAVARRLITPNIKPQTGPDGGGDGKIDAETYEVADDVSDKWYADECGAHGKEKWAFTISCKSKWKEKIISDVKKAVKTNRGYTRILCFTSQPIKANLRVELEAVLSKEHAVRVDIFDLTWCRDAVFQNGCLDIAHEELGFSDEYKRKQVKVGSRDLKRKERLDEIEKVIQKPIDGLNTGYIDALAEACVLSRALERPRTEVEGKFNRAVRECERHGTEPQLFNIIYDHAWTSLFWFEDCDAAYKDYKKLKPFVEADCSVVRLEKLTNLLTVMVAAVRMGVANIDLSDEDGYIKMLEKKVEHDPKRQSCALFLKLRRETQSLIWATRDEADLKTRLKALKPLMKSASMNLEIGFESHYDILKELSERFGGNPAYEEYLDDLADVIAKRDSEVAAARVRFDRAQSHFDANRWKDAIKQLSFCLYAFEKEFCWDELIQSSGMMGLSLWAMRLPYSAEAYLVKAAFLLVKKYRSTGDIPHLLISTLTTLCEIELLLGRLVMYLNWRQLLNMLARNDGFDREAYFIEKMCQQDCSWACRFAACDMNDSQYERLPDVLDRNGLCVASAQLRCSLGYAESVEVQMLEVLKQWQHKFLDQPVFDQFLGDINIARKGSVCLQTTVKNFTFSVEYENGCELQQVAEMFLASMESLMCTYDEFEILPRNRLIKIKAVFTDGVTELKALDADDEYLLVIGKERFLENALWNCVASFIACLFARNAVCSDDMVVWFEKRQQGERMMDRVSILQHTRVAMVGVLGESFRSKIEDWIDRDDRIYSPKTRIRVPFRKEYGNREQCTAEVFSVSKYSGAWDAAGWVGSFFCMRSGAAPYFGLVFKNLDKVSSVIDEWGVRISNGEQPIKIYIIRGISAQNPMWYRIGIVPGDLRVNAPSGRYLISECKRHTLTPKTQDLLNAFERDYCEYGVCWLMACQGDESSGGAAPEKFTKGILFNNVEFKDAWTIDSHDEACFAIGPDDDPMIPVEHASDAPVLAVLEMHRKFLSRKKPISDAH